MEKIEWSSFNSAGKELEYLLDAFRSGWVSGGAYVEKLEHALDDIFTGSKSFAVSNGTAALQLAFQVLSVKPGDQVIVPGFCFQAAGNVLRQLGAVPVFCDISTHSWNQNVETVSRALTEQTVGIVIVHNYGRSAPSEEIVDWAQRKGLWVVEDCAEAWFSKYKNKYLGQFGTIGTFSMHATKTISAGEGGMVLLNDTSLVNRLALLRSHGLNRSKAQYLHELPGNNYRLSNLLCAVAYGQLEEHENILKKQRSRMEAYQEFLGDHWAISLQQGLPLSEDILWAMAVRVKSHLLRVSRDDLIRLMLEKGIETRPGFYPAEALDYNNGLDEHNAHPVSVAVAKEIIVLPCSSRLERANVQHVCTVFKSILDEHKKPRSSFRFEDLTGSPTPNIMLEKLVDGLGTGSKSFRYFASRTFDVVRRLCIALALTVEDEVVGYGHVEVEEGIPWLGIAIIESRSGQGWGKLMMFELIARARKAGLEELHLKVDRTNKNAIYLYSTFGFTERVSRSDAKAMHMACSLLACPGPSQ
jgi:perosamine synthetase